MLANIVDHRNNPQDVWCDVVLEAACHDNTIEGATQFDKDNEGFVREYKYISVARAVDHAQKTDSYITVYLYTVADEDHVM